MRFDGEWLQCDDGIVRPILRCEFLGNNDQWIAAEFLLDTGADRTVFSANVLSALAPRDCEPGEEVRGVDGIAATVSINTSIRMTRDGDGKVLFRGVFPACTDQDMLDMSVLGRDITRELAIIVDRPGGVICLLRGAHRYTVERL